MKPFGADEGLELEGFIPFNGIYIRGSIRGGLGV